MRTTARAKEVLVDIYHQTCWHLKHTNNFLTYAVSSFYFILVHFLVTDASQILGLFAYFLIIIIFFVNTFIVHIHLLYIVVISQIRVFSHPQPYLSERF